MNRVRGGSALLYSMGDAIHQESIQQALRFAIVAVFVGAAALTSPVAAETGAEAWLRYSALSPAEAKSYRLPDNVVVLGDSPVLKSAQQELLRGAAQMLGRTLVVSADSAAKNAIILGTLAQLDTLAPALSLPQHLSSDGYWLKMTKIRGSACLVIAAPNDRGVLYGVFDLLSKIARGESVALIDEVEKPYAPIRWVNQWDNLDGRIERGYGGPSIFFADGNVRSDLTRAGEYARLLASIGINGCTINNVNAAPGILEDSFIAQVSRIADVFRPWGVQLSLSVDLSSPKVMGGLDTFDPLDPRVAEWWRKKVDEIYRHIPDFGGFVVKADSEGRLGPSTYGRTPADAANVIARALKPHGGVVFYRAFVYNHHLDWHILTNDRAKAAYDNFHPLDGAFDDNVIIQIKNGPIDFQVREPASPLFAGLSRTNEAVELQITQEYTGQQRHLCFLVPMWKEVLDFDMRVDANSAPVKDLVGWGACSIDLVGGFVGVANVGMDANLDGQSVSYGQSVWLSAGPGMESQSERREDRRRMDVRLTFGSDLLVVKTIDEMQLSLLARLREFTPVRWEWERSPTLWEIIMIRGRSLPRKMVGGNGIAPTHRRGSGWIGQSRRARDISGSIRRKCKSYTNRSRIAPTTCCYFSTMFRLRTCCIRERR